MIREIIKGRRGMIGCPLCGKMIDKKDKFCRGCGMPMDLKYMTFDDRLRNALRTPAGRKEYAIHFITTFDRNREPFRTEVSFLIFPHDSYELQKLDAWKEVEQFLWEKQKIWEESQNTRKNHTEEVSIQEEKQSN